MNCVACGMELRADSFRLAENIGDCWPVCSACRASLGVAAASGRSALQRRLYTAGRNLSHCDACGREGDLEYHFIRPAATGGRPESRNLLVLCPGCHDQVHAGAQIRPRKTVTFRKRN